MNGIPKLLLGVALVVATTVFAQTASSATDDEATITVVDGTTFPSCSAAPTICSGVWRRPV